jgi:hypothetical protein
MGKLICLIWGKEQEKATVTETSVGLIEFSKLFQVE